MLPKLAPKLNIQNTTPHTYKTRYLKVMQNMVRPVNSTIKAHCHILFALLLWNTMRNAITMSKLAVCRSVCHGLGRIIEEKEGKSIHLFQWEHIPALFTREVIQGNWSATVGWPIISENGAILGTEHWSLLLTYWTHTSGWSHSSLVSESQFVEYMHNLHSHHDGASTKMAGDRMYHLIHIIIKLLLCQVCSLVSMHMREKWLSHSVPIRSDVSVDLYPLALCHQFSVFLPSSWTSNLTKATDKTVLWLFLP